MVDLETAIRTAISSAVPFLKVLHGSVPLKVLTGTKVPYTETGSLNDGYWMEHITDTPQGADYYKLFVIDMNGDRAAIVKSATAFARDGYVYKRNAADPPIYIAPIWEFRVQPTGVRL